MCLYFHRQRAERTWGMWLGVSQTPRNKQDTLDWRHPCNLAAALGDTNLRRAVKTT